MYKVRFKNGAIYQSNLPTSVDDAIYQAWIIYQNAKSHNAHKGLGDFNNLEDFAKSVQVEQIPSRLILD